MWQAVLWSTIGGLGKRDFYTLILKTRNQDHMPWEPVCRHLNGHKHNPKRVRAEATNPLNIAVLSMFCRNMG